MDILKAAVYCGTYGKYNVGSLGGGWLQLAKYKDANEFLKACKELHKDEKSPEFMFQDTEYIPKEFYSESEIYPEIFTTIQAIKSMNEEQQAAFEIYCEENAAIPDMFDVDEFFASYKPSKKQNQNKFSPALLEFFKIIEKNNTKDWFDYFKNKTAAVLKIEQNGGYIVFEKPQIEKEFCWGYGCQGLTQEEASELCKNFNEDDFIGENLSKFDREYERTLEQLDKYEDITIGFGDISYGFIECWVKDKFSTPDPNNEITLKGDNASAFRILYKKILEEMREDFKKKLNTYLKKYGLTKIRKWTYWADE